MYYGIFTAFFVFYTVSMDGNVTTVTTFDSIDDLDNVTETTDEVNVTTIQTTLDVFQTKSPNDYGQKFQYSEKEAVGRLSCEPPRLPANSRIWKGNETHEILLPGMENQTMSWNASIEMQSGDVLLVRIDDSTLIKQNSSTTKRLVHEPQTAVYQDTRSGENNCDVTAGTLLDITPLKVDNRKVVTLYDKDLTEGINLLIVVSELWGNQCIRLMVTVKTDNCGDNEDCSNKGLCYSNNSMDGYECQCCLGFVGQHCEEKDACYPNPCQNNGICVDISQGHDGSTFQCLCPYGFTGKTCQDKTDPCLSMPCQNGGICSANFTQFQCKCHPGFSGPLCQHSYNECKSSCVHGICVDQEDGYKCFCEPGFTGAHCDYEYNECQSSPCQNGGICLDQVGHYSCKCGNGFKGKLCDVKIDLCAPNPCFEPRYCVDNGNSYTCECPKKDPDFDCIDLSRTLCHKNPCFNGGTCWDNIGNFYCACKAGYTGQMCEEELIVEKIKEKNELNMHMPLSIHLDRLYNVYIAFGTLSCAFVIVAAIVTVCYCRVNKTYTRFIVPLLPVFRQKKEDQKTTSTNSEWFTGKNKGPTATPSRNLPSLDTTDMYYTLDFSDSQSSPLIQ